MVKVLDSVSTGRAVHDQLIGISGELDSKDPTLVWLALYEFEAKLLLGHSDIDSALQSVCALPAVEAKTLETMAALSIRTPSGKEINLAMHLAYILDEHKIEVKNLILHFLH